MTIEGVQGVTGAKATGKQNSITVYARMCSGSAGAGCLGGCCAPQGWPWRATPALASLARSKEGGAVGAVGAVGTTGLQRRDRSSCRYRGLLCGRRHVHARLWMRIPPERSFCRVCGASPLPLVATFRVDNKNDKEEIVLQLSVSFLECGECEECGEGGKFRGGAVNGS